MAENTGKITPIPDPDRDLSNESIAALKDDIEQTRAAMSATIDEIQDRIDPRRVAGRAKTDLTDKIRAKVEPLGYAAQTRLNQAASGVRQASDRVAQHLRDHPDDAPKWGAIGLAALGGVSVMIGGIKKLRGGK